MYFAESAGLPIHTDDKGPLLSLLTAKQNPDIYDLILEKYLKTLDTRIEDPYTGEYLVPEKRLRQGWNIAYGKRRSNKWSIAYGKRGHGSPLESEGIVSDEVLPLVRSYPQMSKRQQGWHIAYG